MSVQEFMYAAVTPRKQSEYLNTVGECHSFITALVSARNAAMRSRQLVGRVPTQDLVKTDRALVLNARSFFRGENEQAFKEVHMANGKPRSYAGPQKRKAGHKTQPHIDQLDLLGVVGLDASKLVKVPDAQPDAPGALHFKRPLQKLLNTAIEQSPYGREQIAEMASSLTGENVTKAMIDSWTGAGRPNRFPAEMIPAFVAILGPGVLLHGITEACGCKVTERHEAALARAGQYFLVIEQAKEELHKLAHDLPIFGGSADA